METMNSFKGYGKVDPVENEIFRRKTMRRVGIVVVSAVILIALVAGTVVGVALSKKNKESGSPPPPTNAVQALCSLTNYPASCYSTLSLANTSDPHALFKFSLKSAYHSLSKVDLRTNLTDVVDRTLNSSLSDCKDLIANALDTLNDTVLSVDDADDGQFSTAEFDNLQTWLSSVITDRETCLDSMKEANHSISTEKIKSATQNFTEFTSNSLAIVSKVFGIVSGKNRKLLGYESGFPRWLREEDRRILQSGNPKPNVTVARDGSGDVKTISDAVAKIPKKSPSRFVIYIKSGTYNEQIDIPKSLWNVFIYGDGMGKTVITGSKSVKDGVTTFKTATFSVTGKNFVAKDITFKNTAGAVNHQAVAFRSGSDTSVYYRCEFDAYQDTLYSHSNRQFYSNCRIIGTIDFIFGNAAAVFQGCQILPRQPMANQFNTITAQGKVDPNQNTGISIHKSTISGNGPVTAKTYLGRPWKDYSTTVVMQTDIGAVVDASGWTPWVSGVDPPQTIFYGEYQNTGASSDVRGRVKWRSYYSSLTVNQASKFTVGSFIDGTNWISGSSVPFSDGL